jgi:DEAD/DEAH box helicase domain-containing protein
VPAAAELLRRLVAGRDGPGGPVTHVRRLPSRAAQTVEWPDWVPARLRDALTAGGIETPWRHQVEAAELGRSGTSTVIATGTASGKSLAYQLPVLSTLLTDPRATALYLSPTKALAADQLRAVAGIDAALHDSPTGAGAELRPAVYDGDTPHEEREWIRRHARLVLTNPDMLHHGMLPGHRAWATFLRRLRYVVIDECHSYRGVFGSHVAQVLRRLRRITARYRGGDPVFLLASATVSDPARSARRLTGVEVRAVTEDGAPRAGATFALWEPPLLPVGEARGERGAPVRKSALRESADLLADLVSSGVRTLAFVRSRRGAEVVAANARRSLAEALGGTGLARQVAAYRAGFLPEERRALERALRSGELLGLATTNALELGVDVIGLDAVILSGYPGTLASLWQQAGRAGRAGREALCLFVGRDDPLDTYLVHHPEAIFDRPVESTVLDPANPYVLGPHLCCAAAELPLTAADLELFGGEPARRTVDALVANRSLRARPTGWYWTDRQRPEVDLRGSGGEPVAVVESGTGRLLGTVDAGACHTQVHPGAVYLHQGVSYLVDELDLADSVALVHREDPDWSTHARERTDVTVVEVTRSVPGGPVHLYLGVVDVTSQVVSYQRRGTAGEFLDERPLDLPPRHLRTVAVWYTVDPLALLDAGVEEADTPGALHAAEHAAIGLLPLVATCDRWDIGGLSTAAHPDTDLPTVFVYDGHPGGAGFAERGFAAARDWLTATRDAIRACACEAGCPSCVQSPKCGNGNDPLDKSAAIQTLTLLLTHLPTARTPDPAERPGEQPPGSESPGHRPPGGRRPAGSPATGQARAS